MSCNDDMIFLKTTLNTNIIMGKNTFMSIGHPLPKKTN
jgi:dihydrofolate reductase